MFCPQFLAAMLLVCLFLAALLRCGVRVVPCLPCGLAYGGGIACLVFVSDAVWACVVATLNLRNNFRSGVWVGCPLCFAVFAVGIASQVLLGCGWGCMVGVWPWPSAWQGGWDALRQPGGGVWVGCLWWSLYWVGCRPDEEGCMG